MQMGKTNEYLNWLKYPLVICTMAKRRVARWRKEITQDILDGRRAEVGHNLLYSSLAVARQAGHYNNGWVC